MIFGNPIHDDPTPVRSPGTIADDAANAIFESWGDDQRALIYQQLRRDGWNDGRAENQRRRARAK